MPVADIKDAEEGEVEARELGREELGGDAGAEEWTSPPRRREALSMVGVEVGEEVGLASIPPPVH